jgi:Zn-finger nucleic acid-binding protein
MKCPSCNIDLLIADRQDVEIDFCPQCRGVWLDRGELDKIIERSASWQGKSYDDDDHDEHHQYKKGQHPKKHKSFLGDLFDIG